MTAVGHGIKTWREEGASITRAFSGAFLFGAPLLFTMEMWWIGEHIPRTRLVLFLALAFLVTTALTYYAGFRNEARTLLESLDEAVTALAVGIVAAIVVLATINQINRGDGLDAALGMVALQSIPLAVGAAVSAAVFGRGGRLGDEPNESGVGRWHALANDVGATIAGAIFIGFTIAPTEEIPLIASALGPLHILALIVLTLLVTYSIVFASGFDGDAPSDGGGLFQHPFSETVLAYTISLLAALLMLFVFGQISSAEPWSSVLTQAVVLAFPAAIGGAAGRVVI